MPKNTNDVLKAVADRKNFRKCDAVWTDGLHIYSYATCILAQHRTGQFVLNRSQYSKTTTKHQNAIAAWGMIRAGLSIVDTVTNLDRGVAPESVLSSSTLSGN